MLFALSGLSQLPLQLVLAYFHLNGPTINRNCVATVIPLICNVLKRLCQMLAVELLAPALTRVSKTCQYGTIEDPLCNQMGWTGLIAHV